MIQIFVQVAIACGDPERMNQVPVAGDPLPFASANSV
jgi:hypothetical protein